MSLRGVWLGRGVALAAALFGSVAGARALAPQEVLVVYNSAAANFDPAILAAYTNAHPGVSGVNAPRYFDLSNAAIAAADIAYTNFVSQIRDPIRAHIDATLGSTNRGGIKAIQLLKGVPHRILDPFPVTGSGGLVGDSSVDTQTEFLLSNNLQSASVDAELVLLWKNLNSGQSTAPMSSPSDQFILNPLYNSSSDFDSFSRTNISGPASLSPVYLFGAPYTNTAMWNSSLTPGDMVLVARLDGNSTAAVTNAIARANQAQVNPSKSWVLLDEDGANNFDGTDFESASNYLNNTSSNAWNVKFDKTANFITASEFGGSNLVLYASYGVNHTDDAGQDNQNYIDGFSNKVAPGALFLSYESWNGRKLNGLSDGSFPFTQETAADSIEAGFTFALGTVFEPFTFSVPDANVLARRWLDGGVTFFEAAYLSTFVLSGMNIALGDGLGIIELIPEPPGPMAGLFAAAAVAAVARRARQRNRRQQRSMNRGNGNCAARAVAGVRGAGRICLVAMALFAPGAARGILIFGLDNSGNTNAPSNGAPWDAVARVNGSSAVYLGNRYVLTAAHVGPGAALINGTNYAVDGSFPADYIGTNVDLVVFRLALDPGLPVMAINSSVVDDLGAAVTMIGWGRGKGTPVTNSGTFVGWTWGADETKTKRWATNTTLAFSGTFTDGPYTNAGIFTEFNGDAGSDEGAAAENDSGSGLFVYSGGEWRLAGIAVAVDQGGASWFTNSPGPGIGDRTYYVRLASYYDELAMYIPEPGAACVLLAMAALGARAAGRRRG